jgi:hypothetical protein
MTNTQVSPDSYRVSPPPLSVENPAELDSADLPTNQDHPDQFATDDQVSSRESHGDQELSRVKEVEPPFPASAYHVPPKAFTPSPNPRQPHEYSDGAKSLGPLPHRCQFMFSDGRQCTMARSEIHPSLCVYHSEREEQLFGDPFAESHVRGRSYDLPELFSAARDLSTAASVNRALAQVFRLLAQRRISRQEAATFAKLGHLLLQSIRAAHSESAEAGVESLSRGPEQPMREGVILSEQRERRIPPELSPVKSVQRERSAQTVSAAANSPASPPAPAAPPAPLPGRIAVNNSSETNTSAASIGNSREINTSKNAELKAIHNQHLQDNEQTGGRASRLQVEGESKR